MGDPRAKPDAWKEYIASLEIPQNQKELLNWASIAEAEFNPFSKEWQKFSAK